MYARTVRLIGENALKKLQNARVAVFGLGGVGGYVVEALARGGVGELHLIDNDTVQESNLNRQIFALRSTVGKYKTQAAKERVLDINPNIRVHTYELFFLPENKTAFDFAKVDYVVDAIDTVSGKLAIIEECTRLGIPVISSMGTGNKLDGGAFEVADVFQTDVCPLARVMRRELKKRGIDRLKVVYSKEKPKESGVNDDGKPIPASISFVPPVAGLLIAGEVIKDLIK